MYSGTNLQPTRCHNQNTEFPLLYLLDKNQTKELFGKPGVEIKNIFYWIDIFGFVEWIKVALVTLQGWVFANTVITIWIALNQGISYLVTLSFLIKNTEYESCQQHQAWVRISILFYTAKSFTAELTVRIWIFMQRLIISELIKNLPEFL